MTDMRLQELWPRAGAKNTIVLSDGVRYVMLISKKFICPKCNIFCGELVPVVDGQLRARLRRMPGGLIGNLPRAKVYCKNGCHEHPQWGWENFQWGDAAAEARIVSWPEEWKKDDVAKEKERAVRGQVGGQSL